MFNSITRKNFLFVLIFISTVFSLFAADIFYGDTTIKESVKNLNLGGHSVKVADSGIVFEKCTNGEIVVTSEVGPGMITLKNCKNISLVLECNVCLLLDKNTEIESLYIKENAIVKSLEIFQSDLKNKKIESKKRPVVKILHQENGTNPIIDNVEVITKVELPSSMDSLKKFRKLKITQDKSYKGLGVRFIIENRPETAESLNVILRTNGNEKAIDYISKQNHPERFYSDIYEYAYLEPDTEYEFIFWYANKKDTIIKYYVKAVTSKGLDISFNKNNAVLKIDEETGTVFWESTPSINLPTGGELVYDIISLDSSYNWNYVGTYSTSFTDFSSYNLYDNSTWHFPKNIIDNKVFIHVFYRYQTNRWTILETPGFELKKKIK